MDQAWPYISVVVVVVQASATVAIAFFAMATWRATKTVANATDQYATAAGVTLVEMAIRQYGGGARAAMGLYIGLIRSFRRNFPEEWREIEGYVGENLRHETEPPRR